jgi:hypothetical protein
MGLSEVISCVFRSELRRLAFDSCRPAYDSRPDIVLVKIDDEGTSMVTCEYVTPFDTWYTIWN